jgi:hypothetical protein
MQGPIQGRWRAIFNLNEKPTRWLPHFWTFHIFCQKVCQNNKLHGKNWKHLCKKTLSFLLLIVFLQKMSLPNTIDYELRSFLELLVLNAISLKTTISCHSSKVNENVYSRFEKKHRSETNISSNTSHQDHI